MDDVVKAEAEKLGHRPALDGLRGIAVLLVMFGHAIEWPLVGADFGVELFFVLSGFLITTLLLEEHARDGRISLRGFYRRRAFRLLPALLVFLIPFVFIAPAEVAAALLYVMNIAKVLGLDTPHIGHLWSLAVEEHFYIFWPIVLIGMLRFGRERAFQMTLMLAGAGIVWRQTAFLMTGDHDRVYLSTDTRAAALLIGCVLAFAIRAGFRSPGWLGPAAAVVFGVLTFGFGTLWLDIWGPGLLLAELSMALMVAACMRDDLFTRALSIRPLTTTGRLSYGLYLWHVPIILLLGENNELSLAQTTVAFVASFAVASVSMRLVERPCMRFRDRRPSNHEVIQGVGSRPSIRPALGRTT